MLSPVRIAFLPHPFRFSDTSVNNPSIVGSASHCNRSSPLHKGAKGDSALPTIPKPHYPSKIANTLASLVKGRWIDGKAQTVALLHFYLRYIRLFYSPNFLPSRRRDCFTPTNLSIPTTFSKAHPSFTPHQPFHNLTPQFLIIHCPTFISSLYTLDNFRR